MRLALFDIDGTLTDTCGLDEECYGNALGSVLGSSVEAVGSEWRGYPHVTDSGIAATAVERHLGRKINGAELKRLETVFVELLSAELERAPERCRPIPGAVEFVADLSSRGGWCVGLATGGFRRSALIKLEHAGFDPPEVLATAGEASSRAEIVRLAIDAAAVAIGSTAFESIVLLGDGRWDVTTAKELGLPCVGVGRGPAARDLMEHGAVAVLPDYEDRAAALRVLAGVTGHDAVVGV